MHYHITENGDGNVVDLIPFCSDACHREYCAAHSDLEYHGWNGCQEGGDTVEFCAQCGVVAGGTYECDCQRDNVVVNRFRCDDGEKCEHGHWVQLPERMISP
jgi:hypothetical protein